MRVNQANKVLNNVEIGPLQHDSIVQPLPDVSLRVILRKKISLCNYGVVFSTLIIVATIITSLWLKVEVDKPSSAVYPCVGLFLGISGVCLFHNMRHNYATQLYTISNELA